MAKTANRKAGSPPEESLTPLACMLAVMRDPEADGKRRDDMAKTAAPYVHPRLTSVDHAGEVTVTHEQALDELSLHWASAARSGRCGPAS